MKMEIKSISDIPGAAFYPLKSWAEQSTDNWNILLGIGFLLLMASIVLAYVFYKKMGNEDERTINIHLKSSYFMLLTIILCDIVFPTEYMANIFFLYKYALAILAGGVYLAVQYKRDFL
jgi:hypothetical protein